jgi:ligand-binding sensor domain-containing protein
MMSILRWFVFGHEQEKASVARRVAISAALFVTLVFSALRAEALDPARALTQYQNDHWQTEQGLPQSTVQALVQTRDGHLWIGTMGGLARFDGIRFTTFDAHAIPELGAGSIRGLMEDAEGNLWIGRAGAAVLYKDGRFQIAFGEAVTGGASVWSFCQAADGAVWAATYNGLVRWTKGTTQVFRQADGLPTNRLRTVAFDRDGVLWIGTTGGGLVSYAGGRFVTLRPGNGFPHAEVRAVVPDPEGGIWAATAGGGLARVLHGRITTYTVADGLPTNQLSALALDAQGTLWIGTWGAGLCRMRAGRFSSLSSAGGLLADQVWSLHADREGSLWIGSWVDGLSRLRDRRFLVFGVPEGLSHDNTRSVLAARDGAMWVATAGGGVNRIEGERITTLRKKDGLPADDASSLCEDRDGALWIGTYTAGLARLKGGRFTTFGVEAGLPGVDVRVIYQDRARTIWVATAAGLARFDGHRFVAVDGQGARLDGIIAILEDRAGTLWFGTSGEGLIRLRDGVFRILTTKDGLGSDRIMALHEDERGSLWIGTGGGGIARLRDDRIVSIRSSNGLWDDFAETILEDRQGSLWMTCNRGFFRVARHELDQFADGHITEVTSVGYGASDTLRNTSFSGGQSPSGAVDAHGRLWLPSYKGLVIVDPSNVPASNGPPAVLVEEITANGKAQTPGQAILLPAGFATLTIRYTAKTLVDADRIVFRWRLDGLSGDWVDAGTRREAFYTGLAHGTYRFQVAASVDGKVWSAPSAPFEFTIRPFFHQTVWFVLLVVAVGVGGVAAHQMWRLRRHRRVEEELQQRINRALAEVQTLSGLLPICAWCKRIRNDDGAWEQIEVYVHDHSAATFSHGICPECAARVGPDEVSARRDIR